MPGDCGVEREVARHDSHHRAAGRAVIDVRRIHPAQSSVEGQVTRQIRTGAQRHLLLGIGSLVGCTGGIDSPRLDVNVLLEQIVGGVQPPPPEHLIRSAEFEPVSLALEIVFKEDRIRKNVHGRGRSCRGASQAVIAIVERRDGGREFWPEFRAITHFVREQLLGNEVRAPSEVGGRELKRWWGVDQAAGHQQVPVVARGRAHRSRYRAPKKLCGLRIPLQTGAGLELEAGVVVVLELRADREMQASRQHDLVLHESAVQGLAENGRREAHE